MACNVFLTQVMRQREGAQPLNAVLDNSPWELVANTILNGARVDKMSAKLNRRFLDMLSCKKMTDNNKMLNGLMITDSETILSASREMALDMIAERGLPFFIPLTLLHHDHTQHENFAQFDIHESVLFQTLNGWDSMNPEQRVQFVILGLEKFSNVPHVDDFYTIARLDKIGFFGMLMGARGKCVKGLMELAGNLTGCRHNHTDKDEVDISRCDLCFHKLYINKLYVHFHEAVRDLEMVKEIDPVELARLMNPAYFQSMAIQVLYFVWNGIANFPLNLMGDFDLARTRVFFVTDKRTPAILTREGTMIECNHEALLGRVARRFFFHEEYGCGDCGSKYEGVILHIRVRLDDRNFVILPTEDAVMRERLDNFNKLVLIVGKEPDLSIKLNKLINKHFSECPKFDALADRVKWVCFELIYNRFINLSLELHDKNKHGDISLEEKKRCALQMTFCIRTLVDKKWKKNDERAVRFLDDARVLQTAIQQAVLARMCQDEDTRKLREQKKAAKAAAVAAAPQAIAAAPQVFEEEKCLPPQSPPPSPPKRGLPLFPSAPFKNEDLPIHCAIWPQFTPAAPLPEEEESEESFQEELFKNSPEDRWLTKSILNMLDD